MPFFRRLARVWGWGVSLGPAGGRLACKAETGGRSLNKVEREFVAHDFQQGLVLQPLVPKAYTAHKSYSRP